LWHGFIIPHQEDHCIPRQDSFLIVIMTAPSRRDVSSPGASGKRSPSDPTLGLLRFKTGLPLLVVARGTLAGLPGLAGSPSRIGQSCSSNRTTLEVYGTMSRCLGSISEVAIFRIDAD
jgi:hypothetical protein